MERHDEKLAQVLDLLPEGWVVEDYQLAGMGWAAVISKGSNIFTLHSERGWTDVYRGRFTEQNILGCKQEALAIAAIIVGHSSSHAT